MTLSHTQPTAQALLEWYDREGRTLPWRVKGGTADPYHVWLSEVMLQQTTVKAVIPYYEKFLALWPTVAALGAAGLEDVLKAWAGLGYYSRARNLHKCAQVVLTQHKGLFPQSEQALRTLPGIGDYTAAAIAAIAFNKPALVVDGNIERVITRLFAISTPLPQAKAEIKQRLATLWPQRSGDFAQSLMDLGATLCTPKNPACGLCPWREPCKARQAGTMLEFPVKPAKKDRPLRKGAAFVVIRTDGAVLLSKRPDKGMLAQMTQVPNSEWSTGHNADDDLKEAPIKGLNYQLIGTVRHVFTHFPLDLTVYSARVPQLTKAPQGTWFCDAADVAGEALPNLFRKVLALADT